MRGLILNPAQFWCLVLCCVCLSAVVSRSGDIPDIDESALQIAALESKVKSMQNEIARLRQQMTKRNGNNGGRSNTNNGGNKAGLDVSKVDELIRRQIAQSQAGLVSDQQLADSESKFDQKLDDARNGIESKIKSTAADIVSKALKKLYGSGKMTQSVSQEVLTKVEERKYISERQLDQMLTDLQTRITDDYRRDIIDSNNNNIDEEMINNLVKSNLKESNRKIAQNLSSTIKKEISKFNQTLDRRMNSFTYDFNTQILEDRKNDQDVLLNSVKSQISQDVSTAISRNNDKHLKKELKSLKTAILTEVNQIYTDLNTQNNEKSKSSMDQMKSDLKDEILNIHISGILSKHEQSFQSQLNSELSKYEQKIIQDLEAKLIDHITRNKDEIIDDIISNKNNDDKLVAQFNHELSSLETRMIDRLIMDGDQRDERYKELMKNYLVIAETIKSNILELELVKNHDEFVYILNQLVYVYNEYYIHYYYNYVYRITSSISFMLRYMFVDILHFDQLFLHLKVLFNSVYYSKSYSCVKKLTQDLTGEVYNLSLTNDYPFNYTLYNLQFNQRIVKCDDLFVKDPNNQSGTDKVSAKKTSGDGGGFNDLFLNLGLVRLLMYFYDLAYHSIYQDLIISGWKLVVAPHLIEDMKIISKYLFFFLDKSMWDDIRKSETYMAYSSMINMYFTESILYVLNGGQTIYKDDVSPYTLNDNERTLLSDLVLVLIVTLSVWISIESLKFICRRFSDYLCPVIGKPSSLSSSRKKKKNQETDKKVLAQEASVSLLSSDDSVTSSGPSSSSSSATITSGSGSKKGKPQNQSSSKKKSKQYQKDKKKKQGGSAIPASINTNAASTSESGSGSSSSRSDNSEDNDSSSATPVIETSVPTAGAFDNAMPPPPLPPQAGSDGSTTTDELPQSQDEIPEEQAVPKRDEMEADSTAAGFEIVDAPLEDKDVKKTEDLSSKKKKKQQEQSGGKGGRGSHSSASGSSVSGGDDKKSESHSPSHSDTPYKHHRSHRQMHKRKKKHRQR